MVVLVIIGLACGIRYSLSTYSDNRYFESIPITVENIYFKQAAALGIPYSYPDLMISCNKPGARSKDESQRDIISCGVAVNKATPVTLDSNQAKNAFAAMKTIAQKQGFAEDSAAALTTNSTIQYQAKLHAKNCWLIVDYDTDSSSLSNYNYPDAKAIIVYDLDCERQSPKVPVHYYLQPN